MRRMGIIMGAVVVIALLSALVLSLLSRQKAPPGLVEGRLSPCPDRPNCVCSEHHDHAAYVEPLSFDGEATKAWMQVKAVVRASGGRIVREEGGYLAASFASDVFRFIDDLELRLDGSSKRIHIRSASRVGHSDLGANRKRVARIRAQFSALSP